MNLAPQTLNFGLNTSNNSITLYPVTEVKGTLSHDTVWHRDRHYIVTQDVIVPVGSELKVEAGAVVRFDGYYKILVEGNLQAVGEHDNMVVFTSNKELPEKGDWNRLEFDGVDSTSVVQRCKIEWGRMG